MNRLVCIAVLAVLAVAGTAVAATRPTLRGPSEVRVGQSVKVTARNLVSGRYHLYLVLKARQPAGARAITCLHAVSPYVRVSSRVHEFRGRIPAKLVCYQGKKVGEVRVSAGAYRFQVASPIGPGQFSGRKSFVTRAVGVVAR